MKGELKSTVRRFPELGRFEPGKPRRAAWRRAWREMPKSRKGTYAFFPVYILAWMGIFMSVTIVIDRFQPYILPGLAPSTFLAVIKGAASGLIGVYALMWLGRRGIERSLRRQLIETGLPTCMKCGYDLRGQLEPRCPECGEAFDPAMLDGNDSERQSAARGTDLDGRGDE